MASQPTSPVQNAPLAQVLGPAGGGAPFWGLGDGFHSSNEALLFASDPWDTFWLGTRQLPGECAVNPGQVAKIEINKKKGKGLDGARITITGYDPGQFTVTCTIFTPEQWAELQDIIDVYWTIPGKTRNLTQIAVSVSHPNLAWLKVYSAVLVGISPLVEGKVEGSKTTTMTFQENTVPSKKKVTASSGPPAEDKRKPASAQLQNGTPPAPSSQPENASTSGPPLQSTIGAS